MQRLQRNIRRTLHPHEDHAVCGCADVRGQRRAHIRVATGGTTHVLDAVKAPEPIVNAVDAYLPCLTTALLRANHGIRDDERRDTGDVGRRTRLLLEIIRELLPKEPGRDNQVVGLAQPSDDEIAQAATYGITHQECAGENCHRGRHADDHGQMRAPVVGETLEEKTPHGVTHPPDSRPATSP